MFRSRRRRKDVRTMKWKEEDRVEEEVKGERFGSMGGRERREKEEEEEDK